MVGNPVLAELISLSGVDPNHCCQCGKCSGSCAFVENMDYSPAELIRLLQVGSIEKVLLSKSIWVCSGCAACSAHCIRNLDIARLMRALVCCARQNGKTSPLHGQNDFQEKFLHSLRLYGRVHKHNSLLEACKKQQTKRLRTSLILLTKGKLKLRPHGIKNREQIKHIFAVAPVAKEGGQ